MNIKNPKCHWIYFWAIQPTFRVSEVFPERSERKIWVKALGRAVAGYSLLADVYVFFLTAVGIVLKNFKISFSVLDFGQRGQERIPQIQNSLFVFFMLDQELALQYKNHLVRPGLFLF